MANELDYESKEYTDLKAQKVVIEGNKAEAAWASMIDTLDIAEFLAFEIWCKDNGLTDKFDRALIALKKRNKK